jgi:two-component system, cell cycle response regulator DivK
LRKRVLVIDDNAANLRLFELLLRNDYTVETACSAEEALEAVERFRPDLVLVDVQLPGIDGLTLTRRLRNDGKHHCICIIALTAYAMTEDRDRAFAAGCDGFISKPVDTRTFSSTIETLLAGAP